MIQSANNYFGTVWNTDLDGNKISISIVNEQHVIVDNSFLLNQIPDKNQRVFIDGLVEIDINDKIEAANQFKVDYNYGIVYLHNSKEGQTINVAQYSGKGFIKTYADRIEIKDEDKLYGNKLLEKVLCESAERINNLITNVDAGVNEVNNRVDNLILNQGNSPAEVTDARIDGVSGTTYALLKDRLNEMSLSNKSNSNSINNTNLKLVENTNITGISIESFPRLAPEVSDSGRFQRAINSIKSADQTEATPTNTPLNKVKIPAGKFIINQTIKLPANVHLEGQGKETTILVSTITNGSPVILVEGDDPTNQSFHNSIDNLSVDGDNKNCIGIKFNKVSRWSLNKVKISSTKCEGLLAYESYIGDVYNILVWGCGDSTHGSVLLTGPNLNAGSNAVTFVGGEIMPGYGRKYGLHIEYAASVKVLGMTIEGCFDGYGIIDGSTISTVISGCYMENNKGHILSVNTQGANYTGNFLTLPTSGSLGWIVVKALNGGVIAGNSLLGTEAIPHIAAFDGASHIHYSTIDGNLVTGFPIRIEDTLKISTVGNRFSGFDGNSDYIIDGRMRYRNRLTLDELLVLKPQVAATSIPNSIFIDDFDMKLKFKDYAGNVSIIS